MLSLAESLASHLVDYIPVHIRFDLERYLLIIVYLLTRYDLFCNLIGSLYTINECYLSTVSCYTLKAGYIVNSKIGVQSQVTKSW